MSGSLAAGLSEFRVLVVDDEPSIGALITRALRATCSVDIALRGAEALALIRGGARFDLVLCDVSMPEMNGLEVLATLRREGHAQANHFVFITGGARTAEIQAQLDDARVPVLTKPFNRSELLAVVARHVT